MLFPDTVSAVLDSVTNTLSPTFQAVAPIVQGAGLGLLSGAVLGASYGVLVTSKHDEATPLFAMIGGGLSGAVLGAVAVGICGRFGANPLVATPVTEAAGAAFRLYDGVNSSTAGGRCSRSSRSWRRMRNSLGRGRSRV